MILVEEIKSIVNEQKIKVDNILNNSLQSETTSSMVESEISGGRGRIRKMIENDAPSEVLERFGF